MESKSILSLMFIHRMENPEQEFKPGENRFEAELSHATYDAYESDWDELLHDLGSAGTQELDTLLSSGSLTGEQKTNYINKLDAIATVVDAAGDFEQKTRVLQTIENLQKKLVE